MVLGGPPPKKRRRGIGLHANYSFQYVILKLDFFDEMTYTGSMYRIYLHL